MILPSAGPAEDDVLLAGRQHGCGAGAPDRASCSGRGADDAPGAAGAGGGQFVGRGGAVLDAGVPAAPVEAVVLWAGTRVRRGAGAPDLASDRGRGADDAPASGGGRFVGHGGTIGGTGEPCSVVGGSSERRRDEGQRR